MSRKRMTLIGSIALAMLVAGCANPADNSDGAQVGTAAAPPSIPTTVPSTAAPPAGATSAQPAAPSAPGEARPPEPNTPAPAANPAECKVADLRLSLGGGEGAAGTVHRELRFTNKGGRTCVIQGFPGVSYVAGEDGHQVGPAAFREGAKGAPISLRPGMTVFAPLGFTQVQNFDPAVCRPTAVRGLRVYPPHEYDSMFLAAPGTGCAGTPPGHQLVVRTIR